MKWCVFFVMTLSLEHCKNFMVSCTVITRELCDQGQLLDLAPSGKLSSVTILLNPKDYKKICRLNITAPASHVINLQWQKDEEDYQNDTMDNSSCPLSVFLPEDKAVSVWKGNPCMKEKLPDVDLLTPNLMLTWNPPRFLKHVRGRKLVITAVGQDEVCIQKGQHVCMRIGWKPMLCVSEELVCDGNLNCPKGSSRSDEDPELCKGFSLDRNWKRLGDDAVRKLHLINTTVLTINRTESRQQSQEDLMNWKDLKSNEVILPDQDHSHDTGDSVSAAIAHYGTWGYLMLAMLIVGTILMFCGLWECCFRKPKPPPELQPPPPSTTVLIINRTQESTGSHPPNYDDLDQPPAYAALFPQNKTDIDIVIRKNETIPNRERSISSDAFSSACESSDEQSDSYFSVDDRVYSSETDLDRVNHRLSSSSVFCIAPNT